MLHFIEEDSVVTPQAKKPWLKSGQKVAPVHPAHKEESGDTTEVELLAENTVESIVKNASRVSDHELEIDQVDESQPPLTHVAQSKNPSAVADIEEADL